MINLYGKYFCLLDLVITVSSISFQLRVNSALPLLDDLKLTVNNTKKKSEASNHYIKTENSIQKIKSWFLENILFLETYINDTWLPLLIFSDIILLPT